MSKLSKQQQAEIAKLIQKIIDEEQHRFSPKEIEQITEKVIVNAEKLIRLNNKKFADRIGWLIRQVIAGFTTQ